MNTQTTFFIDKSSFLDAYLKLLFHTFYYELPCNRDMLGLLATLWYSNSKANFNLS